MSLLLDQTCFQFISLSILKTGCLFIYFLWSNGLPPTFKKHSEKEIQSHRTSTPKRVSLLTQSISCVWQENQNQSGTTVTIIDRLTSCALPGKSQGAGCVCHTLPILSFCLTAIFQAAARMAPGGPVVLPGHVLGVNIGLAFTVAWCFPLDLEPDKFSLSNLLRGWLSEI